MLATRLGTLDDRVLYSSRKINLCNMSLDSCPPFPLGGATEDASHKSIDLLPLLILAQPLSSYLNLSLFLLSVLHGSVC